MGNLCLLEGAEKDLGLPGVTWHYLGLPETAERIYRGLYREVHVVEHAACCAWIKHIIESLKIADIVASILPRRGC